MSDDKQVTDKELDDALLGMEDDDVDDNVNDVDDNNDVDNDVDGNVPDDESKKKDDDVDWENELHLTKTAFGRKQKALETQVETLTENVNKLVNVIESGGLNQQRQLTDSNIDPDEPIPLTMGGFRAEIRKEMNTENREITVEQQQYQDGYLQALGKLGSGYSDKVHQHIVERMDKDFNIRYSDNPALDVELNFYKAKSALTDEIRIRKKNPLKGDDPTGPLGGATNVSQDSSVSPPVKLDKAAADFIKSVGMKEEDAQKALQGDMPLYLRGKVSA